MNTNAIKSAYQAAKEAATAAKNAIGNDTITDDEFDALCIAECEANDALIAELVKFANGALTDREASYIVLFKFDKLGSLIARLAA